MSTSQQYVEKSKPKKSRKRNKKSQQQQLQQLHGRLEQENKLTLADVESIVQNRLGSKKSEYDKAKQQASKDLQGIRKKQIDLYMGRKIYNQVLANAQIDPSTLSFADRQAIEHLLVHDDIGNVIKNAWSSASQYLKPALQTAVSMFAPQFTPLVNGLMNMGNEQSNNARESIRVKRRWLLTQAYANNAGTPTTIDINPGLSAFGQWLSQISRCYEYYTIHGITLTYKPAVSLTTAGNLSYYIDLDPEHDIPNSSMIPQQYKAQQHAAYTENQVSYVEEELMQYTRKLKIRNDTVTIQGDTRIYDIGFFCYVSNFASTIPVGSFYIECDLTLSVPVLAFEQLGYDCFSHNTTWLTQDIVKKQLFKGGLVDYLLVQPTGYTSTVYQIKIAGRLYSTIFTYCGSTSQALVGQYATSPDGPWNNWTQDYSYSASNGSNIAVLHRTWRDVVPGEYFRLYNANQASFSTVFVSGYLSYDPTPFMNGMTSVRQQDQMMDMYSELKQLKDQLEFLKIHNQQIPRPIDYSKIQLQKIQNDNKQCEVQNDTDKDSVQF